MWRHGFNLFDCCDCISDLVLRIMSDEIINIPSRIHDQDIAGTIELGDFEFLYIKMTYQDSILADDPHYGRTTQEIKELQDEARVWFKEMFESKKDKVNGTSTKV